MGRRKTHTRPNEPLHEVLRHLVGAQNLKKVPPQGAQSLVLPPDQCRQELENSVSHLLRLVGCSKVSHCLPNGFHCMLSQTAGRRWEGRRWGRNDSKGIPCCPKAGCNCTQHCDPANATFNIAKKTPKLPQYLQAPSQASS